MPRISDGQAKISEAVTKRPPVERVSFFQWALGLGVQGILDRYMYCIYIYTYFYACDNNSNNDDNDDYDNDFYVRIECACMHMYIYIYTYRPLYIYTYTCTYIYIYIYSYNTYLYIYILCMYWYVSEAAIFWLLIIFTSPKNTKFVHFTGSPSVRGPVAARDGKVLELSLRWFIF